MNENQFVEDQPINNNENSDQLVLEKFQNQNNQKNSKVLILLLTFIVIFLLIIIGIFGYKNYTLQQEKKQEELSYRQDIVDSQSNPELNSDNKGANPQDIWNTHTIPGEQLTFKYPQDWKLKETENKQPVEWGADSNPFEIELISPNNFLLRIMTNVDGLGGGCPEECQENNLPNQVLGTLNFYKQPLYIILNGTKPGNSPVSGIIRFNVIPKKECWSNICYGFEGTNTQGTTIITGQFMSEDGSQSNVNITTDDFVNSADVKTAIKILESLSYQQNDQLDKSVMEYEQKSKLLVHENIDFGFRVSYPSPYSLADNLQLDNKNWKPNQDISFIDTNNVKKPTINLRLDYDGYGPNFPLEIWNLSFDNISNKLSVIDKNIQDTIAIEEATGQKINNTLIMTSSERTIFMDQERSLTFILKYSGVKDLEIESQFEDLIESFELIK